MAHHPGIAATMSLLLPGMGQIYNGTFWRAIFRFLLPPGLWIGSGGTLGWICHIIAAYTAHNYAQKKVGSVRYFSTGIP